MFQNGCEKDITSNQLTTMALDNRLKTEESEAPMISEIPDETVDLDQG